jgi:hypothetical protein
MPDDGSGQLRAVEVETRKNVYVFASKVAAVMDNAAGGVRLIFGGGGHVNVCGMVESWRIMVRLAQLKEAAEIEEPA